MVLYFEKFHKNSDNQYEVSFPDLEPYAATYGDTLEEAIQSAHDSLTGYLLTEEDFHEEVPTPTDDPEKFKLKEPNFLVPVQVDLQLEREKEENKLVKKAVGSTLTGFLIRSVQDLNLRAKENLVRRISSPVHYHSANTP